MSPLTGELTIFCGALVGASLGFLWYNSYPADIFMGDVGSLALGGALGTVALLIKQEFVLVIVGGVFVLEAALSRHPGGLVQADRQARLPHGAAAPPLRTRRLERTEGDRAIRDPRDHLRPVQPHDAQAAMTAQSSFSVTGQRVVVVGAASSGVAAAELLVRRGATVMLTDVRQSIEETRLRDAGVQLELGSARCRHLARRGSHRAEPGCAAGPARHRTTRAPSGVPVMGELELASRWLRGRIVAITGTKGKSTTTTLTGRMLEAGGHRVLVGGNIGLALSAQVEDSTEDTIHVVEASSFQLERPRRSSRGSRCC